VGQGKDDWSVYDDAMILPAVWDKKKSTKEAFGSFSSIPTTAK
jgi:hypothetical protein